MSGNFAIKGGGVGRLMANAILNFHFDFPHTSLFMHYFQRERNMFSVLRTAQSVRGAGLRGIKVLVTTFLALFKHLKPRHDL